MIPIISYILVMLASESSGLDCIRCASPALRDFPQNIPYLMYPSSFERNFFHSHCDSITFEALAATDVLTETCASFCFTLILDIYTVKILNATDGAELAIPIHHPSRPLLHEDVVIRGCHDSMIDIAPRTNPAEVMDCEFGNLAYVTPSHLSVSVTAMFYTCTTPLCNFHANWTQAGCKDKEKLYCVDPFKLGTFHGLMSPALPPTKAEFEAYTQNATVCETRYCFRRYMQTTVHEVQANTVCSDINLYQSNECVVIFPGFKASQAILQLRTNIDWLDRVEDIRRARPQRHCYCNKAWCVHEQTTFATASTAVVQTTMIFLLFHAYVVHLLST